MSERETQTKSILNYLTSGGKLTGIDALKLSRCFRLPARIHDLKSAGHNITTNTPTTHKDNK